MRDIRVYRDLIGENEKWAGRTRALLKDAGLTMLNVIGSPGAGKTALLEQTVTRTSLRLAVLEGDIETTRDAERLAALGIPASQLLTGGACHLEAKLVHCALQDLPLDALDLVVVENVGNLVCPAEFDIGEHGKVAVLSVTEGEDKPLKYPLLFQEASAVVLTKTDLLPHVPFDMAACLDAIDATHHGLPVFQVSALRDSGMTAWVDWVTSFGAGRGDYGVTQH